jgi:broad specificity phosphatase PhoE
MKLYFVRHGESEANVAKVFSNQKHELHPLTQTGREQAQTLAEKLRDVKFTAIYASPMLRARQTAEILNAPHELTVQFVPALLEHDAGNFEGRADEEAWNEYSRLFETWVVKRDLDARIEGGESFNDMHTRFAPFLNSLVDEYGETDANILLVGHAGIFHAMLPLLLSNVSYEFGYHHILSNTAVVTVELHDGALCCISWDGVELEPKTVRANEI